MAVTAKDCHALTSYFVKVYKEKYGKTPVVNRHSARWGFEAVLMDMKSEEARILIDYYFKTKSTKPHSVEQFLYNYDKLQNSMNAQIEDAKRKAVLRKESEERAKEWKARGNTGIEGN